MEALINDTLIKQNLPSPGVVISSVIVLAAATVVGTLGNLLLLVVIATSRKLRSIEAIFVTNLALSDLYVTSVADPMGIVETQKAATKEITEGLKPIKEEIERLPQVITFPAFPSIEAKKSDDLTDEEIEEIKWFRDQMEKESDPLLLIGPEATKQLRRYTNKDEADTTYGIHSKKAKIYGAEFFDRIPGLCQTVASLCTISCVTSLMTIALMSANRYFYICQHEKYRIIFTYRNVIFMCLSLYLVGTFLVLLNLAGIGDHSFDHKSYECIWDRMATFPYTVVFSVTLVWIPTLITGTCYLRIYLYVSAHRRKIQQHDEGDVQKATPTLRKLNLAKTLFTIYAVFTTCWIPYALLIVIDSKDEFPHEVHIYITMFAHLHPSLNWIIYYVTNKKFADAYKQLFNRCLGSCCFLETAPPGGNQVRRIGNDSSRGVTETTSRSNREQIETINVKEAIPSCSEIPTKTEEVASEI